MEINRARIAFIPISPSDFKIESRMVLQPPPFGEALVLSGHSKAVVSCKICPGGGSRVATASADATAKIWDIQSEGQCASTLSGHSQGINDVAWNVTGNYICTASDDHTLKLWVRFIEFAHVCAEPQCDLKCTTQDAETGKALKTLTGHTNYVFCCAFHPFGNLLVGK